MKIKQKVFIVIGLLLIIGVSFAIVLIVRQKNMPKNELTVTESSGQTFYANIESIKQYNDGDFYIGVKGLERNNINYRGEFTFKADDSIDMTWKGEKIGISDLKEGDTILITFNDEILITISPTPLEEVVKVQLIKD